MYDIVTPEVTYQGYNVVNYDYDRNADNVGLLEIDVWVEEVVIAGSSSFSNTSQPNDQSKTDLGVLQPGSASMFRTILEHLVAAVR